MSSLRLIAVLVVAVTAACGGSPKPAPTAAVVPIPPGACDPANEPSSCPKGGAPTCERGIWSCESAALRPEQ